MNAETFWSIENGVLNLFKGTEGLESLDILFEYTLETTELRLTNAQKSQAVNGEISISAEMNGWGSANTQVEIVYAEDSGALLKLQLSKSVADFANLILPQAVQATFENLTLSLYLAVPNNGLSPIAIISYQLAGQLSLGESGFVIPFIINNPDATQPLLIESRYEVGSGPGLNEFAALLHPQSNSTQDLQMLPQALPPTNLVSVRDLQLRIDPNDDDFFSMISVTLDFFEGDSWPIIPNVSWLSVGKLWLRLQVDYPLNSQYRFPVLTVGGTIQIGDYPTEGLIDINARWPDFAISGRLSKGSQIELGRLLGKLDFPENGLSQRDQALVISQLSFGAEPTMEPTQFNFLVEIDNAWSLGLPNDQSLELTAVIIGLDYVGGENGRLLAQLRATIQIDTVELRLSTQNSGGNTGWTLEGETGEGQQIPLGRIITDELIPKFGNFQPPAPIAGLVIENLSTSFNTSSKDFSFSGETLLPLNTRSTEQVDLTIIIDLKNQTNGGYSKQFSGVLKLKELEFDVLFDIKRQVSAAGDTAVSSQPTDSQTFLAIFNNPTGISVPVDDLLSPLGFDRINTGLSFTIKEALLAYQKTSENSDPANGVPSVANGKWLFGIDIEGGLNLSAIHIDDLPFVSIPPDQTLKLDFQVLAASRSFTQDEIQTLSGLAPSGLGFPTKPIERIDLSVTLDFGTGRKQVDLPIGLQTRGRGNGMVPAGQRGDVSTPQIGSGITATSQTGVRWINLQKQLGPLAFERIGVKYADRKVTALLDASFSTGGLTIALNGLLMSSPISEFNPTFGLDGLGIDFKNASVEIGGTFLKEPNGFAGLAVIRTEAFSLSAIGAYGYADGQPSLFIYAVLDYPLGGPAFFYVTGIAAGFGYNRKLVMLGIEQVASFPLVREATGESQTNAIAPTPLPTDQQGRANTLQSKIRALDQYIPIENGHYFLAVGLKFTSFKHIDSFALLVVQFGNKFEIDLLGLSTLKVPSPAEGGTAVTPVAEAQLALKAVFIPSEGFLGVRAQLTNNSYILSRACTLTGGFAFYSWFSGEHSGDFVLTLGGYHSAFNVPSHYPRVPRLGFSWRVSNNFYLHGELYFALTANALMAGGRLDALFQTSNIKAWFVAGADFLIAWKPYHYEISVFVSLGLEVTFKFFGTHTVGLSAGANLKLWGPEFGGEAHIKVKVLFFKIPVDVTFGKQSKAIPAITFDEFASSYIPADESQVCSVSIKSGLIGTVTENGEEIWIVNAKELALVTNSMIPSSHGTLFGQGSNWNGSAIAIQPMGVKSSEIRTTHELILTAPEEDSSLLLATPIAKKSPYALWGEPEISQSQLFQPQAGQRYIEKPQVNGERFVEDTLAGYEIRAGKRPLAGATHPVSKAGLQSEIEETGVEIIWQPVSLNDPIGSAGWEAAVQSDQLITNPERNDIFAAMGLQQLEVDFGEPII